MKGKRKIWKNISYNKSINQTFFSTLNTQCNVDFKNFFSPDNSLKLKKELFLKNCKDSERLKESELIITTSALEEVFKTTKICCRECLLSVILCFT